MPPGLGARQAAARGRHGACACPTGRLSFKLGQAKAPNPGLTPGSTEDSHHARAAAGRVASGPFSIISLGVSGSPGVRWPFAGSRPPEHGRTRSRAAAGGASLPGRSVSTRLRVRVEVLSLSAPEVHI